MSKQVWIDYSSVREALDFPTVLNYFGISYETGKRQVKVLCPLPRRGYAVV